MPTFQNLCQDSTCVSRPTRFIAAFPLRQTFDESVFDNVLDILQEICDDVYYDGGYLWHQFRFTVRAGYPPCIVGSLLMGTFNLEPDVIAIQTMND